MPTQQLIMSLVLWVVVFAVFYFLLKLMESIRQAIREERLLDFREEVFTNYGYELYNDRAVTRFCSSPIIL